MTASVQVRREPPKTWKRCLARSEGGGGETVELRPETSFVRNNEGQENIQQEEMVVSYR